MAFETEFDPDAWEHLQRFSARDQSILLDKIEEQLRHQPGQETRKRRGVRIVKTIALETCALPVHDLVKQVEQEEAIILTENGEPRYVLGIVDEFEWEVLSLSHNEEFVAFLDRARKRAQSEGTISLSEVRRRLNIPAQPDTNTATG